MQIFYRMSSSQETRREMESGNSLNAFCPQEKLEPQRKFDLDDKAFAASKPNSYGHRDSEESTSKRRNASSPQDLGNKPATINLRQVKLPFPWKLHQLLDDLERDGRQDIASWLEDGNSFRIHKPDEFSKDVMNNYFRQTKLTSFIRQLYVYGFLKIESGPGVGGYHHPKFVRGNISLTLELGRNQCDKDRRCRQKKEEKRTLQNIPDSTQDFATIKPSPPLHMGSETAMLPSTAFMRTSIINLPSALRRPIGNDTYAGLHSRATGILDTQHQGVTSTVSNNTGFINPNFSLDPSIGSYPPGYIPQEISPVRAGFEDSSWDSDNDKMHIGSTTAESVDRWANPQIEDLEPRTIEEMSTVRFDCNIF